MVADDLADETSRATSAEASLTTRLSNEESRATAAEDALDLRIVDIEDFYLDKRVGGTVTGSLALSDGAGGYVFSVSDSSVFQVNTGFRVQNAEATFTGAIFSDLGDTGNVVNIAPFVAKLETSGSNDTAEVKSALYTDLTSFTGIVMINFMVVAMDMDGSGNGMGGEYRMTAFCDAGVLTVGSVVELEQGMVGANLDVNILSDGTVRVQNGTGEGRGFKWHVQRVKMLAVAANGDVK